MQWYKNPGNLDSNPNQTWQKFTFEANVPDAFHQGDFETADVDDDGKLDIVVRSLGINRFVIYFQSSASDWDAVRIDSPYPREGVVIGDLDGDRRVDIIGNGFILFEPSDPRAFTLESSNRCMATDLWEQKTFDANVFNASQFGLNNSSKGEVFDMDGDVNIAGPTRYARAVYLYRNTTADDSNILTVSPSTAMLATNGESVDLNISSRNASNDSSVTWTASTNQAWLS